MLEEALKELDQNENNNNQIQDSTKKSNGSDYEVISTISHQDFEDEQFLDVLANDCAEKTNDRVSEDLGQYKLVQFFKNKEVEAKFLDFFYGKKKTSFRVGMLVVLFLITLVFLYDFLTFSMGVTVPKKGLELYRILFQSTRGVEVGISFLIVVVFQIPLFYKRSNQIELFLIFYMLIMYGASTVQTIIITDRSLVLTVVFCVVNLLRIRSYGVLITLSMGLLVYIVFANPLLMEDNVFVYVTTIGVFVAMYLLEFLIWYYYERNSRKLFSSEYSIKESEKMIMEERNRGLALLKNIMPESCIEQLHASERYIEEHQDSSVMAIDVVNFTKFSETISAGRLINFLNKVYSRFDVICEKFSLEKVTTIGDAYLLCSLINQDEAPKNIIFCGKKFIKAFKDVGSKMHTKEPLGIRMGIAYGHINVVLMGSVNFSFSIYGPALTEAEDMEVYGKKNEIHISNRMYEVLSSKVEIVCEKDENGRGYFLDLEQGVFDDSSDSDSDIMETPKRRYIGKTVASFKKNGNHTNKESTYKKICKLLGVENLFDLLLVITKPDLKENLRYIKKNIRNSVAYTRLCFAIYMILVLLGLGNFFLFSNFNWYYMIPVAITCAIWIFGAFFFALSFIKKRNDFVDGVELFGTCLFAFGFSVLYVYSIFIITIVMPQPTMNAFFAYDLLGQIFPFLTLIWPTLPFSLKLIFVLVSNLPFNVLVFLLTAIPSNLFNFFCTFVSSIVGFYFYHLNSLMFYKRKNESNRKIAHLSKELSRNQDIITSSLPAPVIKRLLITRKSFVQNVKKSAVSFGVIRGLKKIKDVGLMVDFVHGLICLLDDIMKNTEAGHKIKNVSSCYLLVSKIEEDTSLNEASWNEDPNRKVSKNNKKEMKDMTKVSQYSTSSSPVEIDVVRTKEDFLDLVAFLLNRSKHYLKEFKKNNKNVVDHVSFVFGVNFGNFSAGVVGKSKWLFDVFGQTINVSYRYAQTCKDMKIHLSPYFVQGMDSFKEKGLIANSGDVFIKGVGQLPSYYYVEQEEEEVGYFEFKEDDYE